MRNKVRTTRPGDSRRCSLSASLSLCLSHVNSLVPIWALRLYRRHSLYLFVYRIRTWWCNVIGQQVRSRLFGPHPVILFPPIVISPRISELSSGLDMWFSRVSHASRPGAAGPPTVI